MNREEMAQAFRENTALHTALSNALMDDIKCLRQDVQNVVADFNNFVNVTGKSDITQLQYGKHLYIDRCLSRGNVVYLTTVAMVLHTNIGALSMNVVNSSVSIPIQD